ncbi:MAG: hypothetical protein IPJ87_01870 [Flavobacteriales bacterium]|nr:hypothetical protein [Flavobacteriales bacterium]
MPTDTGAMSLSEHTRALQDFTDHFRHATAGSLSSTRQHLLYEELQLLMDVLPAGHRLVVVHLGLDGNAMVYGLSFVRGTPSGGGLDFPQPDAPSHFLDGGYLRSITATEWQPLRTAYRTQVMVDRGDGGGFAPLTDTDPLAVTLPWDAEIDVMYRSTVEGETGPFRLGLSSVAVTHDSSDGGPEGFRHGVAFHVEQRRITGWTVMLDDTAHDGAPFRFKADDYGSLCPPRCGRFER